MKLSKRAPLVIAIALIAPAAIAYHWVNRTVVHTSTYLAPGKKAYVKLIGGATNIVTEESADDDLIVVGPIKIIEQHAFNAPTTMTADLTQPNGEHLLWAGQMQIANHPLTEDQKHIRIN